MELKAFLSHRYKSPDVNLYFHALFAEAAEVQFEVDVGKLRTNVTRLERMVRDSDAFIGIYPFPGDAQKRYSSQELLDASKYFRLECDLAVRSRKPSQVFFDQRYFPILQFPKTIHAQPFDIQEVTGRGGSPRKALFNRVFRDFCKEVKANMTAAISKLMETKPSEIGLLVPTTGSKKSRYGKVHIDAIEQVLGQYGFNKIKHLRWPPILDSLYLAEIETLDWVIADIGKTAMNSGIVGYLHGRFVPTLRLLKGIDSKKNIFTQLSYRGLYGGTEAGYPNDIVSWENVDHLIEELDRRLFSLTAPSKRISSHNESEVYFREASLRKEPVFLSYSGKDSTLAVQISAELKRRFQQVFDYKDGKSITPGEPWIKKIFDQLSAAALGIPLVSDNYLKSGNCIHEAQDMVGQHDAGKMEMIAVKLYEEVDFEDATWMKSLQYIKFNQYPDIQSMVDNLVESFDQLQRKSA
jgi:hypothetical protein